MANFVLSAHMTNGDVLPFLRLAAALRKRGHQVTLVSHGIFQPLAEKAGVPFKAIDEPEEYTQKMKDLYMLEDPMNNPQLYEQYYHIHYKKESFWKEYHITSELCQAENSVLICKERDGFVSKIVSEVMGVPIVTAILAPSYLNQIKVWEDLRLDLAIDFINVFRQDLGLPPAQNWISWMRQVKRNIAFWPEEFAPAQADWGLHAEAVGFPLADESEKEILPQDVLDFIHGGEPPLLITGGTSKLLKPHFYQVAIEACRLAGRRTLLVTRHEELVPEELPPNIMWHKVLPLASVYPLLGGVIHHGGIGTTTGALYAGVPQLALAADSDRPDNAMRVKRMGVGEYLPPIQWEPPLIAEAIESMLSPAMKQACVDAAAALRKQDPMAHACRIVESVASKPEYAISSAEMRRNGEHVARPELQQQEATQPTAGSLQQRLQSSSPDKRALLVQQLLHRRKGVAP